MSGVELWWLGQSGFRLRDPAGGPSVFVDPFLTNRDDRTWQAPLDPAGLAAQADLVLCSHQHVDHFDQPALRGAAAAGAHFTLVVPRPIVPDALALGFPESQVVGAQPGEALDLAGIRVHPVPARHGVNVSDAYTFGTELSNGLVRYLGYVVEVGGLRVYHAGDCIPYEGQVERLRALQPDLALLPINGRDFFRETLGDLVGNMDSHEAARIAADVGAKVLVPMHWELFPGNRGYPSHLAHYVASRLPSLTLLIMGRGAKVVFGGS